MLAMSEKTVWAIKVLIETTEEQSEEAVDAIAKALCPDEDSFRLLLPALDDGPVQAR